MKFAEITSLSAEQLKERIESEEGTLQKLKFAHAISPIENPMKIRESRRLIAKLKTGLSQKLNEVNTK